MSKYCINCGNELAEDSKFCNKCGVDSENNNVAENNQNVETANQGKSKTNGQAIAAFVVSLVGLFIFGVYCGLISLGLGITALKHIKAFPNEKGKGLAIVGIVIGAIDVIFVILGTILTVIATV